MQNFDFSWWEAVFDVLGVKLWAICESRELNASYTESVEFLNGKKAYFCAVNDIFEKNVVLFTIEIIKQFPQKY